MKIWHTFITCFYFFCFNRPLSPTEKNEFFTSLNRTHTGLVDNLKIQGQLGSSAMTYDQSHGTFNLHANDFSSEHNYTAAVMDKSKTNIQHLANGYKEVSRAEETNTNRAMESAVKGNLGLTSQRAMTFIFLWYFFSAVTLFSNKYLLSNMHGDPVLLSKILLPPTSAGVCVCVCPSVS